MTFGGAGISGGKLVCDDGLEPGDTFKYNPSTGHFLATATPGYVNSYTNGTLTTVYTDTPFIAIGKCSKR